TCRIAAHHFLEIHGAVREMARVLRPDGRLLVVDSVAPDDAAAAAFLHDVEVLRDPTHVRAYTALEWRELCTLEGLHVERMEVFPKRHAFEDWLDRGGAVSREVRDDIRRRFREAGASAGSALSIETADDGAVIAYTDEKVALLARRRGHRTNA